MNKKKSSPANRTWLDTLLSFLSTLPGILTGLAAVITAIVGLYLALGSLRGGNIGPVSPTPSVSATPKVSQLISDSSPGACFEQEFGGGDQIAAGSGTRPLRPGADVSKIKLMEDHQPVGALSLKFSLDDNNFEIEKVVDSKCKVVGDLFNSSRNTYVDRDHKVPNNDYIRFRLGEQNYSLRLMSQGSSLSVLFEKLR